MIKIIVNKENSKPSSRINLNLFEKKATEIYSTIVKSQINNALTIDLLAVKKETKNCNNPI